MPLPFDHPSVSVPGGRGEAAEDNRSVEELRADVELGLDGVREEVRRCKASAPTENSNWHVTRVKKTLERMRKVRNADMTVINRFSIELAQLEGELERARKTWLVGNNHSQQSAATIAPLSSTATEDDIRRKLLQGHQRLGESERELDSLQRSVTESLQMGRSAQVDLEAQGDDLHIISEENQNMGSAARNAARVITRMTQRAFYNRLFLYFMIALLVFANCLLLYFGYIKKH